MTLPFSGREGLMQRIVEGLDRTQSTLFPEGKPLTEAEALLNRRDELGADVVRFVDASVAAYRKRLEATKAADRRRFRVAAAAAGNASNGILLALEALPDEMAKPNRSYVHQGESALYAAINARRELVVPRGYRGSATHAAFSPDGSRIVTASLDKTARLWPNYPTTQSLIDYARCIVPRQLTDDERERFFLEPESPSEAGHEGRLRDCCPQVVDNLASADGLLWPVAVAFKENIDRCCPPRLAGVLAALTAAAVTAGSVATAVVAAGGIFEQARSLGHFVGNGAAQQFSAQYYAAGDHRQEHGVFDRRDAPRVGP